METMLVLQNPQRILLATTDFSATNSEEREWLARPKQGAGYIIGLLNYTGVCFTHAATRPRGTTNFSKPFTIQKTCQNCGSIANREQCIKDRKYSLLFSVDCTAGAFDLFVGYQKDPDHLDGGIFEGVTPDCNYAGVICDYT